MIITEDIRIIMEKAEKISNEMQINLSGKNGVLAACSKDGNMVMQSMFQVEGEDGSFKFDKVMLAYIKKMEGSITAKLKSGFIHLQDESKSGKFPEPQKIREAKAPTEALGSFILNVSQLHKVLYAVAVNEVNPILKGVSFKVIKDSKIEVVTLDGYRAAKITIPIKTVDGQPQIDVGTEFVLTQTDVQKLLSIVEEDVTVMLTKQTVFFTKWNIVIGIAKMEGKYVNYDNVYKMLDGHDKKALVDKDELKKSLNSCAILGNNTVLIEHRGTDLIVSNRENSVEVVEKLSSSIEGNLEICFNSRYLLDAINTFDEEEIEIEYKNGVSAIGIKVDEIETLVLPVKMK